MRIGWTAEAEADLAAIYEHFSVASPQGASRLLGGIVRRVDQLAEFPLSGRVIPELGVPLLRELIEGGYRLMYEVFSDRVEMFAVLHGARDIPSKPE